VPGGSWSTICTCTTNSKGVVTASPLFTTTRQVQAVFTSPSAAVASTSTSARTDTVSPAVSIGSSAARARYDAVVKLSGVVKPGVSKQKLYVERIVSGKWKILSTLTLTSSGAWAYRVTMAAHNTTWEFRAVATAVSGRSSGVSKYVTVKIVN
jgi:hypothetical protein